MSDPRPRPLVTTAAKQSVFATSSLLSGPGYLAALTYAGLPIGRLDILGALLLSAVTAGGPLYALVQTVLRGERLVTPLGSERDAAGQPLVPGETQELARALLAARRQNAQRAQPREQRPAEEPVSRTSAFPDVTNASSMLAPGRERQRAAPPAGSPSADPPGWTDWPDLDDDHAPLESRLARARRDPLTRGREVAARNDRLAANQPRRHELRGDSRER